MRAWPFVLIACVLLPLVADASERGPLRAIVFTPEGATLIDPLERGGFATPTSGLCFLRIENGGNAAARPTAVVH